jgi:hypothetical protein
VTDDDAQLIAAAPAMPATPAPTMALTHALPAPALAAPGAFLPAHEPTPHRHPAKRNAKPKAKPHHRNAGPPIPRATARSKSAPPSSSILPPLKKDTFYGLLQTLGGAAATSVVGAYAVRWGFHPELVSAVLGATGGLVAWRSDKPVNRAIGAGAASAAGSQLLLLQLTPPRPAPQVATPTPTHGPAPVPTQVLQHRGAELGALPPGMLDAAFERARAELAVTGDGYPQSFDPHDHHAHHQFHHGPAMP